MQKTPNYQLNLWAPEDHVIRTDFNEDNTKVDAALVNLSSDLSSGLSSLSAEMQTGLGNLSSSVGSQMNGLSAEVNGRMDTMSTGFDTRINNLSAQLTAGLAAAGNCNIATGSYQGTGSGNAVITFPVAPKIAFIFQKEDMRFGGIFVPGCAKAVSAHYTSHFSREITFSGNTLTIKASDETPANNLNGPYTYLWVILY